MGRSVYTDRNPSLIRELFTHEVVNEDAPANIKLAQDKLFIFYAYKTTMGHQPILWKRKSPNETTTDYIEEKWVVIIHYIYEPMHEPL